MVNSVIDNQIDIKHFNMAETEEQKVNREVDEMFGMIGRAFRSSGVDLDKLTGSKLFNPSDD